MKHLILGTAGHIDHGKTSLVKALTGTDTDRLPEEKARGITIDIGFAALDLGETRLGIVDVPGHERFIKNMLAGATGIDLALLVVAADDSVMPQTREHLEILQFLGVKAGVIALTKADLADETTREVAKLEIEELVEGTFLADAKIIPTSTATGLGIEELKSELLRLAGSIAEAGIAPFRLPIDRVFVRQGHGTVVTGTVISGVLNVGDEVEWHHDGEMETVRVRGLNHHGKPVESICRGQRGAVNLAGLDHSRVRRGQELAAPHFLKPSRVFSLQLRVSKDSKRPLKHRLPVRFHLGTEEIMGKLSLLEGNRLEAGEASIAQIFLEQPATAIWGQPFVIRDSAAEATLAGGSILQPNAGKIRRRQARAIEYLKQLQSRDDTDRLAAAIWFNEWTPMDASNSSRHAGIDPAQLAELMKPLSDRGIVDERAGVSLERITDLGKLILKHLARLHAAQPLLPKHDRDPVLAAFAEHCPPAIFDIAIARLLKARKLVGDAKRFARADFKPRLGEAHLKLMERVIAEFAAAGLAPPAPADYANAVGGSMKIVKEIFQIACEEGLLVKVNDDIYLHKSVVEQMVEVVKSKLVEHGKATVAEIRDWLGTTRKYAVPICEYLDRVKLTRRQGDNRMLV